MQIAPSRLGGGSCTMPQMMRGYKGMRRLRGMRSNIERSRKVVASCRVLPRSRPSVLLRLPWLGVTRNQARQRSASSPGHVKDKRDLWRRRLHALPRQQLKTRCLRCHREGKRIKANTAAGNIKLGLFFHCLRAK